MKFFSKILSILMFAAAFGFADSTTTATVDSATKAIVTDTATDSIGRAAPSRMTADKKRAVWIKLEGDVEPSMYDFCARAIADALKENPDYIVFEINTFGGRLDAAFDLVDTIMAVKGPETIALVKKKAISAGSLIALACKKLYMLEATTIGDCAPIVQGGDGTPQIVGEKIQSPLRAKFRNLAQRNGYPELLSSSFVTPELEVLELTAKLDKGKKTERDTTLIIEGQKFAVLDSAEKKFWGAPKILGPTRKRRNSGSPGAPSRTARNSRRHSLSRTQAKSKRHSAKISPPQSQPSQASCSSSVSARSTSNSRPRDSGYSAS